ncbi:hypothetical protein A9995_00155 [Erythrobacter sp. QSSC1-22B]|uniref:hypothetical protein n=1 Tax=Erythrobacter sp. QSSC1-22B TaxID=1860125 RepID=UPI0008047E93|nr:hypothetical protein [Erythrobacter sp. QSSC1-22B]OBX20190.1 hypothetical protein A9995_00155 [Erythrobacter sp. QSSC1-22B]
MRYWLGLSVVALAGCGAELSPEEKARQDAQAVAEVTAAQIPPVMPVTLDPLTLADVEAHEMIGVGCSFLPDEGAGERSGDDGDEALAIAMGDAAYAKSGGEVMRLAPDRGSAANPFGTQTKYDGREFTMQLDLAPSVEEQATADAAAEPAEGVQVGMETMAYDGRMTLTDGRDRVVYRADGTLRCGS